MITTQVFFVLLTLQNTKRKHDRPGIPYVIHTTFRFERVFYQHSAYPKPIDYIKKYLTTLLVIGGAIIEILFTITTCK